MPTSRGSCSGSGVLLDMALNGRAPAALVFREDEDVLTLGALIAAEMFGKTLPVLRLSRRNVPRHVRRQDRQDERKPLVGEGADDPRRARRGGVRRTHESDRGVLEGGRGRGRAPGDADRRRDGGAAGRAKS